MLGGREVTKLLAENVGSERGEGRGCLRLEFYNVCEGETDREKERRG